MSPGKRLNDRHGYATETVYDSESQRFVEQPVGRPFPSAEPSKPSHCAGVTPTAHVERVLAETEGRMRTAHATHLGYPYNLVGRAAVRTSLGGFLINNLGDPYAGSHYASEVCALEREAVAWLMDL